MMAIIPRFMRVVIVIRYNFSTELNHISLWSKMGDLLISPLNSDLSTSYSSNSV